VDIPYKEWEEISMDSACIMELHSKKYGVNYHWHLKTHAVDFECLSINSMSMKLGEARKYFPHFPVYKRIFEE